MNDVLGVVHAHCLQLSLLQALNLVHLAAVGISHKSFGYKLQI